MSQWFDTKKMITYTETQVLQKLNQQTKKDKQNKQKVVQSAIKNEYIKNCDVRLYKMEAHMRESRCIYIGYYKNAT